MAPASVHDPASAARASSLAGWQGVALIERQVKHGRGRSRVNAALQRSRSHDLTPHLVVRCGEYITNSAAILKNTASEDHTT